MKTYNFIILAVPSVMEQNPKAMEMNSPAWYLIGALIALFLLAYLIYALIKPEKF